MESLNGFVNYLMFSGSFVVVTLWLFGLDLMIFPDKNWLYAIAAWLVVCCFYILLFHWGYYFYYYKQTMEGNGQIGFHLERVGFLSSDKEE